MSFRPVILILMYSLFAISANRTWAYGNEHSPSTTKAEKTDIEKSCCSEREDATDSSLGDSGHSNSGSNCPCDHDNGGCHCPGCGLMCHAGGALALETLLNFAASLFNDSVQKMAFYFADHLPEAVYISIWQPPKIDA